MTIEVLDPTYGGGAAAFALAPRLGSLEGKTVGVISNGKRGTRPYFAALERMLLEQGAARVVLRTKSNYSAPADAPIMAEAADWDAAFVGIGD
ncbi:MAG: hypothetical protein KDC18_14590 [Alphaproteobacteria bacterium]|nr:hypothetical protein [Alphaproteobacteria bacterium]MCB9929485.1 hypothetical protein [Alphaproteobacteria bacterium]